jgi:L-xylulose reductase
MVKPQPSGISFDFTGKSVVVTGAGKGIGRALAEALHQSGCHVCAITRTQADLDDLEKSLGKDRLKTVKADLGNAQQAETAMDKAIGLLGRIDFLVNNAGIASLDPFLNAKPADFENVMKVNVQAPMVCSQVAARWMIKNRVKGSIVNVSSQASIVALPDHTSYCTSKAALDMLTKMTALELGSHGIRCNAVNPTVVMTDMGKMAWGDDEKAAPMLDRIPLDRFAKVCEVVEPVLFLLSEGAGMINGSVTPIEGGLSSSCTLKTRKKK